MSKIITTDIINEKTTSAGVTFGQFPITPAAAPDADYEVANKKYVDDNIGGGDATSIQGVDVSSTAPTNGQQLVYNSTSSQYEPSTPAGGGDVTGPSSSTDNAVVRFDSTSGKAIQNSTVAIDDNGAVNIPSGQSYKINGTALAASDVGAVATSGDETVAGVKTFSSFPISPSSAPTTDYQVANKKYIDDTAAARGMWTLVERYEAPSDVTSYTFTGLDGNTARRYLIVANIIAGVTADTVYMVRPNADSGSNYNNQRLFVLDAGSPAGDNGGAVGSTGMCLGANKTTVGNVSFVKFEMHAKSGLIRNYISEYNHTYAANDVGYLTTARGFWTNTADNITSLQILADQATGIKTGSIIELWKLAQ